MPDKTRVLLIEGNVIIRKDLENLLRSWGNTIITLSSTDPEAVHRALEMQPDLVLMDIFLRNSIPGIEQRYPVISIDKPFNEVELKAALEAVCKTLSRR